MLSMWGLSVARLSRPAAAGFSFCAITDRLPSGAGKELAAYALALQELFTPNVAEQSSDDRMEDM
jgi:hypothetical protein